MFKVYISPSEQENNKYAFGNYTEEEICHRIGNLVQLALHRCGIDSKKAPYGQHMEQNISESNAYKPDIHLCIHTNAANGAAGGCVVFVSKLDDKHMQYAKPVYDALHNIVGGADFGVRAASFAEIKQTTALCVYCECEFHDNPSRAEWIVNNMGVIAEALVRGICEGAGIEYVPKALDEFAAARSAAMDKDIMRGNGKADYWTTPPTRQELAVILRRAGVI